MATSLGMAGAGGAIEKRNRKETMGQVSVQDVERLLPQTQCRDCGYADCSGYAEALARGGAPANLCAPGGREVAADLNRLLGRDDAFAMGEKKPLVARVVENDCIGCARCAQACPVDAIVGMRKRMHVVLRVECSGCGLCVPACPVDCIVMVDPGAKTLEAKNGAEPETARLAPSIPALDGPGPASDKTYLPLRPILGRSDNPRFKASQHLSRRRAAKLARAARSAANPATSRDAPCDKARFGSAQTNPSLDGTGRPAKRAERQATRDLERGRSPTAPTASPRGDVSASKWLAEAKLKAQSFASSRLDVGLAAMESLKDAKDAQKAALRKQRLSQSHRDADEDNPPND